VEGEAKELFIDEGKAGLFFEPENATDLNDKLNTLVENRELLETFGIQGQKYVKENFDRELIHQRFLLKLEEEIND